MLARSDSSDPLDTFISINKIKNNLVILTAKELIPDLIIFCLRYLYRIPIWRSRKVAVHDKFKNIFHISSTPSV